MIPAQNLDLTTETLREKDLRIEAMAKIIESLDREIQTTHLGLMALHKELEVRDEDLEIARRNLAASEKFAALGSLVSGVAHEVRTPLTIIATNLHVLDMRASKAVQTGDYASFAQQMPHVLREVLVAIERVQSLVKSLGRFTQSKSTTIECLLDPIVGEAVDLYAAVNRSRTRIVSDLHAPLTVLVDKSHVQQIVINLIENAVQALHSSTEPVSVRTYVDADGTGIILEVKDHGIGMSLETMARMFEPLFTTKPEGTGVGLTIVQRIAREHHATISCESELGHGTTFMIRFPTFVKG